MLFLVWHGPVVGAGGVQDGGYQGGLYRVPGWTIPGTTPAPHIGIARAQRMAVQASTASHEALQVPAGPSAHLMLPHPQLVHMGEIPSYIS